MGSGINIPSQAVSAGFSSASSLSVPNLTPSLPTKDSIGVSPYLLDENFKLLALRHILELSNREHAISSLGMNQKEGRFCSSSDPKVQGSVVDTLTSDEPKYGWKLLTGEQNAAEGPMKLVQSGGNHRMGVDIEKVVPVPGKCTTFFETVILKISCYLLMISGNSTTVFCVYDNCVVLFQIRTTGLMFRRVHKESHFVLKELILKIFLVSSLH